MSYWYFSGVAHFYGADILQWSGTSLPWHFRAEYWWCRFWWNVQEASSMLLLSCGNFGRRDTEEHDWLVDEELLLEGVCWLVIEISRGAAKCYFLQWIYFAFSFVTNRLFSLPRCRSTIFAIYNVGRAEWEHGRSFQYYLSVFVWFLLASIVQSLSSVYSWCMTICRFICIWMTTMGSMCCLVSVFPVFQVRRCTWSVPALDREIKIQNSVHGESALVFVNLCWENESSWGGMFTCLHNQQPAIMEDRDCGLLWNDGSQRMSSLLLFHCFSCLECLVWLSMLDFQWIQTIREKPILERLISVFNLRYRSSEVDWVFYMDIFVLMWRPVLKFVLLLVLVVRWSWVRT